MNKIAIIGLSCLFPDAQTPEQYWQNLLRKQDSTSLATEQQMGVDANVFYTNQKGITDKYYCLKGGYIKDFKFVFLEIFSAIEIVPFKKFLFSKYPAGPFHRTVCEQSIILLIF